MTGVRYLPGLVALAQLGVAAVLTAGCLSVPDHLAADAGVAGSDASDGGPPLGCMQTFDFGTPAQVGDWTEVVTGESCDCGIEDKALAFWNGGVPCSCVQYPPLTVDLTSQAVSIELVSLVGGLDFNLGASVGELDYFMSRGDGQLYIASYDGGNLASEFLSMPLDPVTMRYWRIRWEEGLMKFETSHSRGDRTAWSVRASASEVASEASLQIGSYEDDSDQDGEVVIDNLWICPP